MTEDTEVLTGSRSRSSEHRGFFTRALAATAAMFIGVLGLLAVPMAANAAPNTEIVVDEVVIGGGTGPNGQLVVGDRVVVSGTWDASQADPQAGDTFSIGLPPELSFPEDVPFELTGVDPDGNAVTWGTCVTSSATGQAICTLTEEVTQFPELVNGTFEFEVDAVQATTEESLNFDLNGSDVEVDLPGEGGIDDGIDVPDTWGKSGEMNDNNWSMKWTIDLPGSRMAGNNVINVADSLSANHVLCDPPNLKVETVRGNTVTDVTGIAEIIPGTTDNDFTIRLTAPQPDGFDPNVTYRVTYDTCTPDGEIDPPETEYTNEALVDVWGESSGVIGVNPDPWQEDLTKSGSVLGGGDRNGKIAWSVTVPGDQLLGKDGFNFSETLGQGHEVCSDTIDDIKITERYGPSNQMTRDVTALLTPTVSHTAPDAFDIDYSINAEDFEFRPSDYRYVISYETCVSQDGIPASDTSFSNEVSVDGVVAGTDAEVPGRTDEKNGSINTSAITLDGVEHLAQTTLNWNITVPGERLNDVDSDLTVTDALSGAHEVCEAGDPSGGLSERLGLKVEARDQIRNGGLESVDLTDSVVVSEEDGTLSFTIPQPNLPQPDGGSATGFSAEYQYVISYSTCTSSGGMDSAGTTYGNAAEVNGKTYEKSVTQNNRGSGTGGGVTRGSVAISKTLADTPGAAYVPAGSTFTVHVEEVDPSGTTQVEYDLEVPVNGDPQRGLNPRGNGWTLKLSEPTFPTVSGVVFGTPVFEDTPGVAVGDGGTTATAALTPGTNIAVSLENEAVLGSVSLTKAIEGGAAGLVPTGTEFDVTVTTDTSALGNDFPELAPRSISVTAGEPVVLNDFPIGATVSFSETQPADDDQFTWGEPVFSPASVVVTGDHTTDSAMVTLTNTVERTLGTFEISKLVTGEQADNPAVPDEVVVTAIWEIDGAAEEKTLTLPTDGTPVPFGEEVPVGTVVTLTETPLEDGSSIFWGAPTWSGPGVSIDGESAVVSVARDAGAIITLENHAATSTAGLSLLKGISGEAASAIDADTEFPVTATWTDSEGSEQSRDLTIRSTVPTELGEDLPAGTVVTISEGDRPEVDGVVWNSIVISGAGVTDGGDGTAQIIVPDQQDAATLVTVLNEATWAPGTFSLAKQVSGLSLDHPEAPEAVDVVATWFEGDEAISETLRLPVDGTVVPVDREIPHGTEVTLTEVGLDDATAFTWDRPEWSSDGLVVNENGSATITVGAAQQTDVVLTNRAIQSLGSVTVTKSLSGSGANTITDGTTFPVIAKWTDLEGESREAAIDLPVRGSATIEDLPLGTEVTFTEGKTDLPRNVKWTGASWTAQTDTVAIAGDGEGDEITVTISGGPGDSANLSLENTFAERGGLAVTGSEMLGAAVLGAILLLVTGGAMLLSRRRRA